MKERPMNAATLTSLRATYLGPDGDLQFVQACRTGQAGKIARAAAELADRQPTGIAAYTADRIIELVNLTDPAQHVDCEFSPAELTALHDAAAGCPEGPGAFVAACMKGILGPSASAAARSAIDRFGAHGDRADMAAHIVSQAVTA